MNTLQLLVTAALLSCGALLAKAQTKPDTAFVGIAIANGITFYENSLNSNFIIHNGAEYIEPTRTNEAHPFFESEDWVDGTVDYEGSHFKNVSLLYDITSDKVVAESSGSMPILLVHEKLLKFTIGDHAFIKLKSRDFASSLPLDGFYELIYDGMTRVVALHQKSNEETLVDRKIEKYFNERHRIYMFRNGVYYHVKGRSSLLKALEDRKSEIKRFIRREKFDFKIRPYESFRLVATYYDTLTTSK
jgi:hypothetical protein